MFNRMIRTARDAWFDLGQSNVDSLINYMISVGKMRDAQIEAIKTYLFLKIACDNKPLAQLFCEGRFNVPVDLNELLLSYHSYEHMRSNPAALALYQYAGMKTDDGKPVSEKLFRQMEKDSTAVDCEKFFRDAFYGVSYTDYLFSLPMGAGKTYLMAAFIYLDLYFAQKDPTNPAFARNFIILAPSGLKSSVVPSLRTIQKFDPAWIIKEPYASRLRRELIFETLDQPASSGKSTRTKNPNVRKISNHHPLHSLHGLVAVTNAEKVILDRVQEKDGQIMLFEDSEDDKDRQANELRNLIGKLPSLSIFIDEVHHAVSDEIKLRAVVNRWAANKSVNSVIGFSGTPYLPKAEKIPVSSDLSVASAEINNNVFHYPLIDGIGNFLKTPVVKIAENASSEEIISSGVRYFLDNYKDKVYDGGLCAKLAIYCGSIRKLEEQVYPIVNAIAAEYGLGPETILKFYRKPTAKSAASAEKAYVPPADSQMQFDTLDMPISKIRFVLLVQIGKEGWDCRSLTGVVLSQEGDCPKNMVLQTSCRCLRQVEKNAPETAVIYLNDGNAKKLDEELRKQQRTTLEEFSTRRSTASVIKRYDRTDRLKLPKVDFYQFCIRQDTLIVEKSDPHRDIPFAADNAQAQRMITVTTDIEMKERQFAIDDNEHGERCTTFTTWLYEITKQSFGGLTMSELLACRDELKPIFERITYEKDGERFFSSKYDVAAVNSNVFKAFCDKRDIVFTEENIPQESSLLNIANFTPEIFVEPDAVKEYYPDGEIVDRIMLDDEGKWKPDEKQLQVLKMAEECNLPEVIAPLRKKLLSHVGKDRSFHYLPYHTDSEFERRFMSEILGLKELEAKNLELYYNGDRTMTEFKIKCYRRKGKSWRHLGIYTPDFLIIGRKDGKIHKVVIVETKGEVFAGDPRFKDRRTFMEEVFVPHNNKTFGYKRFDYLYLEDNMTVQKRMQMTHDKINEFFKEESDNGN